MIGKLSAGYLDLPTACDVCGSSRGTTKHKRCSRIRQQRHADMVRNEELDRLLMFDKKESGDDPTIPISRADDDVDQ